MSADDAGARDEKLIRVSAVFTHPIVEISGPAAEIDELRWLEPTAPLPDDLAPMLRENVLPALGANGAED